MLFKCVLIILLINSLNVPINCGNWSDKISKIFTGIKKVDEIVSDIFSIVSNFNGIVAEFSQAIQLFDEMGEPNFSEQLKKEHDEVMEKLSHVSNQIDDLSHSMSQGFEIAVKEIITNMEDIDDFTQSTHELSDALETINIIYEKSERLRKDENTRGINRRTLADFTHHVFEQSNDIPTMLNKIYSILFKPVSLIISKNYFDIFKIYHMKNYKNRCDKPMSPHQRLYYTYLSIMTIELKGILTIAHGYSMRALLRQGSFKTELKELKDGCLKRMKEYMTATKRALQTVDRDIRRCDPIIPIRDVTFVELEKFSYVELNSEETWTTDCSQNCEDTNPKEFPDYYVAMVNPFSISGPVKICLAGNSSSRLYSWLKPSGQDYHGRYTPCHNRPLEADSHPQRKMLFPGFSWMEIFYTHPPCDICGSTYYGKHQISVHAQSSDIANNMIVTGLKLTRINETIFLQIKQGKLTDEGGVYDDEKWKNIASTNNSNRIIHYRRRNLYLDDVIVAPNYAVTGVSFRLNKKKDGYKLVVRGTKYNFTTGQLDTKQTKWFDPEDDEIYASGYYGNRTEILVENLDNPIFAKYNKPDKGTNKFVAFTRSSFEKDAGQTTIPLLDSQPVSVSPALPLSGVGLYYKGALGFGGYVAPRIFTDSVDNYLDISDT